jgi:KDO2-lipid IV(A) lauroyltransferase
MPAAVEQSAAGRKPCWWLRLLAAVPLPLLYALSRLLAFLAFRVFPYRSKVVAANLRRAFPALADAARRDITRRYYQGYGDVLVEIIKSASLTREQLRQRVQFTNLQLPRSYLERGRPLLLLAGHQCNWEWLLLALSSELGWPLDAAYKPLVNPWAEREMQAVRCRFGARLVPAQQLLGDIIQRRNIVRAIAMVADQEPVHSEQKHWTSFLGRDSAFFLGAEEISRKMRYPALFITMCRTARGHYEIGFQPLADPAQQTLRPGEFTERYAQLVQAQIHAAPADWPWSHKRWRLRKPLYG